MSEKNRMKPPSRRTGPDGSGTGFAPLARFGRDEDGALLIFGLFIFTIMLMVGGLSVDLMRYESERTRVQNTADGAALAAASMRQELDPTDVVEDYFLKAGLAEHLTGTVVDEGLNYRNVRANTHLSVRSYFMHMMGIDRLEAVSAGAAEERKTNVEIAMVLDISGSMQNQPTRIINLRNAADEFIDRILADDDEDRVSISIVPYNGQVNLSPELTAKFNITHQNSVAGSNCVDLPGNVYSSIGLSRTTPMSQTAWADTFSSASTSNSYQTPQAPLTATNVWCPNKPSNYIQVVSNNANELRGMIAGLEAVGATSIDAGLKWGAMLLDPSARPLVAELAAEGQVPWHFSGRPFDYDDPEVLKVVVLMTDGEHFEEERMNDAYKSGPSPIYRHTDGNYSIFHSNVSGSNKFWIPHKNAWRHHRWAGENCTGGWQQTCTYIVPQGSGTPLTWPQVWDNVRVKWVAWQLYGRALGNNNSSRAQHYNTALNNFRTLTPIGTMDARLLQLCDQVKEQNVVIFGIAFEAPVGGRNLIRNCATNNRFYDVQGLEIQTAFRQIRSQISSLRLTQ